jgi:predicted transcriptional regulator
MNYLTEYQTFKNKQQLNDAIHEHLTRHKYDLNETDRKALKMIARYAVKFAGAAHLKAATIAQLIGKSEKTARRVVNKLADLGIIRKVPTIRKINGGKGANILQILPVEDGNDQSTLSSREGAQNADTSTSDRPKIDNEPINSFKLLNNYFNNTYAKQSFYCQFRELIASTFGAIDKRLIYKLYGVFKGHSVPLLRLNAFDKNTVESIGLQALKTAIMATKRKKIRNLCGHYSGVLDRMLDDLYFAELDEIEKGLVQ